MKDIVIWGYGYEGYFVYKKIEQMKNYNFLGFADNDIHKQGNYVNGKKILSLSEVQNLAERRDVSVIISPYFSDEIERELRKAGVKIEAKVIKRELVPYSEIAGFDKIDFHKSITFYAGDVCEDDDRRGNIGEFYGLSLSQNDRTHIRHDITTPYPIPDNSIEIYQAEHVLEHISYESVENVIWEIVRILKPGGLFRISLPDYNSPILSKYVLRTKGGEILFDPQGGGKFINGEVVQCGHMWFPTYESVKPLLMKFRFSKVEYLRYFDTEGNNHKKTVDMEKCFVHRINNDLDNFESDATILIDCYK